MKITSRMPDGSEISRESDTFPCETVQSGWRVTLVMGGESYRVTVARCDPRCIETALQSPTTSRLVPTPSLPDRSGQSTSIPPRLSILAVSATGMSSATR